MRTAAIALVAVLLLLQLPGWGQGKAGSHLEGTYFSPPPTLDGDLGDACYRQATPISDLREMETGGAPKEPTTFWLGYDERYLYWAVYCKDSQPGRLRADQKKRGGSIFQDDVVEIDLDTYRSHKEAYYFDFNPCGTQFEYIPSGSAEKTEWRGDWEVKTKVVSDGWTGEARIPLSMLRYPVGARGFGVMVSRHLAREGEWYLWPPVGTWDMEKAAEWEPLKLPRPRAQVTSLLYAAPEWHEGGSSLAVGLDTKVKLPGGTEAQFTANPDFADVAQDVSGIDFTYTERYLSESRPFFVEGRGLYPGNNVFYTRRIEDIDVGAKWFGRVGEYRLGFLEASNFGHRHSAVANWCWDFRPYSSVSALAVFDDNEDQWSAEYGAGFSLGDSVGPRGNKGVTAAVYSVSVPGVTDTRRRWYAETYYNSPSGRAGYSLGYSRSDEGFDPPLGYFPESGLAAWSGGYWRSDSYRTGALRSRYFNLSVNDRDTLDGETYDHTWEAYASATHRDWWSLSLSHTDTDRPPYRDRTEYVGLGWKTNDMYRRGGVGMSLGRRLDGDYRYVSAWQCLKLSERLSLQASGSWVTLEAPSSDYGDRQLLLTGTYDFDPEHTVSMRLVDADSGFNAYCAYTQKVRRGMDLYVIVGDPNADEFTERVAVKSVWAF